MRELLYTLRFQLLAVVGISILIGFLFGSNRTQAPQLSVSGIPDYYVRLEKDGAHPGRLAISLGEMIEFDSHDGSYHNIVQVTDPDPNAYVHAASGYESGVFAPDEGYQATFTKPGSYIFHDHLHPNIVIYVDVHESTTTRK